MSSPSRVLALYCGHNATAALLIDGQVAGCLSEERILGVKNVWGFPERAVELLLAERGLAPADLDAVAVGFRYISPNFSAIRKASPGATSAAPAAVASAANRVLAGMAFAVPGLRTAGDLLYQAAWAALGSFWARQESRYLARRFRIPPSRVLRFDHHLCHAYSAYYGSPFSGQDALVLTLDGDGDGLCATVNEVRSGLFRRVAATPATHSPGWLYQQVTEHLGMKPREDEYKVMGLAPYAKDAQSDRLFREISPALDLDAATGLRFVAGFNTFHSDLYLDQALRGKRFDNVAAAVQRLLEERVCAWAANALAATGLKTLCLAGGVFMNVKVNQRIAALPGVERLFIVPSCGDESTPIGAGYAAQLALRRRDPALPGPAPISTVYLGPSFSTAEIDQAVAEADGAGRFSVRLTTNPEVDAARLLAAGKVVARLAGRMEFGARSLGNRSILAHPNSPGIVRVLNEAVKNRDFWMPFAPALLAEKADRYLLNPKGFRSPYMMLAFDTTGEARRSIPAALHPYDFTARAQMVETEHNPRFHRLLEEFDRLTGIAGVLNTSFNLHGEPIVLGPREALRVFLKSGLAALVMEDRVLEKRSATGA